MILLLYKIVYSSTFLIIIKNPISINENLFLFVFAEIHFLNMICKIKTVLLVHTEFKLV